MAAVGTTQTRSGGFFKLYLFIWAVAAAAGLAYLASLATSSDAGKPGHKEAQAEGEQTLRLASRALSELGTVRRSVGDMQRDLAQVKENLDQREAMDKQVQSRLSALEEKVTTLATPSVASTAPPAGPANAPKQKAADKTKAKAASPEKPASRVSRLDEEKDSPDDPYAQPQPRVETGSLTPREEEPAQQPSPAPGAPVVTFGAPVVTKGATSFAVQIGAGASPEALRNTWKQLQAKHENLASLEPRIIAPKVEGGKYRLVAGPFTSKADAEKACTDMGVGRTGCFSTTFGGQRL